MDRWNEALEHIEAARRALAEVDIDAALRPERPRRWWQRERSASRQRRQGKGAGVPYRVGQDPAVVLHEARSQFGAAQARIADHALGVAIAADAIHEAFHDWRLEAGKATDGDG